MEDMVSYTQAAVERAMKVQEVILRAMAKKIAWVASEGKEVRGVRHFSRFSRKLALSESPKGGPAEPSTPFGSALPGRRPDSSSSALPTESSHPASDHPHRHPTRHARE